MDSACGDCWCWASRWWELPAWAPRFTLKELCLITLAIATACVGIGVACEIVLGTFRPWSGEYRFSGTVHPNTQGAYLATLGLAALCLAHADKPRQVTYWFLLFVAMVLLVLTKSRTSTAGTLFALGVVQLTLSSRLFAGSCRCWAYGWRPVACWCCC